MSVVYAHPCPDIDKINEVVSGVYGVLKDEMCVKGRKRNESRDVAIYLSAKYTRCTYDEIGEYFGGIRPSAVSLGSRRIIERMKTDKNFKKLVRQLESDVIGSGN